MRPDQPPTLDYAAPAIKRVTPHSGKDIPLLGAFGLYAVVNFLFVAGSGPPASQPFDVLLAFAVPLPVGFVALAVFVRYFASPPLFSRTALVVFVVLVFAAAAVNVFIAWHVATSA
jgi:hypothetical protein